MPFGIVADRQAETWQQQAFWCSTTMTMMSFDGSTKYVWNPFSLKQLQDMLAGGRLDTYMQCVATGGQCTAPSHDIFDTQQVMRSAMLTSLCSVAHACWAVFNGSLSALPSPVC